MIVIEILNIFLWLLRNDNYFWNYTLIFIVMNDEDLQHWIRF